jgi:hypothetical protein
VHKPMKIVQKPFAIGNAFDYISAPWQAEQVSRETVKCPSG